MAGQIFMRVDEVAEELGVSKPYAYKLIKRMNGSWHRLAASRLLAGLTGNSFMKNSTVRGLRRKGRRAEYGRIQK